MKRLEDYLSDATRGLSGRRKKAVQLELRGAVEDKLHRYQISGLSQEQALEQTLQDLGSARALRGGFFRLHSAPLLGQLGALVLASSAAVLALWPSSAAQVVATQEKPDYVTNCAPERIQKQLTKNSPGAKRLIQSWFKRLDERALLEVCELSRGTYSFLDMASLESEWKRLGVSLSARKEGKGVLFPGTSIESTLRQDFAKSGKRFVSFYSLAYVLTQAELPVSVRGVVNPYVSVGDTTIQVGSTKTPVPASELLDSLLNVAQVEKRFLYEVLFGKSTETTVRFTALQSVPPSTARLLNFSKLEVPLRQNASVALIYVGDEQTRFYQVAFVDRGKVQVFLTASDVKAFPPAANWEQLKTGKLERPQWLLLDLSKTTDWRKPQYSIIAPSSIKLQ